MPEIKLTCYGIIVNLVASKDGSWGGRISSDLKHPDDRCDDREEQEYNIAIDGIESLILAHACAGIDVASPAYIEGVETAVQAIANNPSYRARYGEG